mgnify:CR=1 FL=1
MRCTFLVGCCSSTSPGASNKSCSDTNRHRWRDRNKRADRLRYMHSACLSLLLDAYYAGTTHWGTAHCAHRHSNRSCKGH